jgi:hypothetical protein
MVPLFSRLCRHPVFVGERQNKSRKTANKQIHKQTTKINRPKMSTNKETGLVDTKTIREIHKQINVYTNR